MKRRANLALKSAIVTSGKSQLRIAALARINETLLSHYVCGRRSVRREHRGVLARVLGKPERELFGEVA